MPKGIIIQKHFLIHVKDWNTLWIWKIHLIMIWRFWTLGWEILMGIQLYRILKIMHPNIKVFFVSELDAAEEIVMFFPGLIDWLYQEANRARTFYQEGKRYSVIIKLLSGLFWVRTYFILGDGCMRRILKTRNAKCIIFQWL